MNRITANALTTLALALAAAPALGQAYDVVDLGPVVPNAINNHGHIAGVNEFGRAFLFADGRFTDLGTLGGPGSAGMALNDLDQVVGQADDPARGSIAALFDGESAGLGTLGGAESIAYDINDAGLIVGESSTNVPGVRRAFAWIDGTMVDLGTLGGSDSCAYAVNNKGQVVGASVDAFGKTRCFLYEIGELTGMRFLAGISGEFDVALDINDRGRAVGYGLNDEGIYQAFVSVGDVAFSTPMPHLQLSAAVAINDHNQVVGYASSLEETTFATFAARFEPIGVFSLNELIPQDSGWTLTMANDVNDQGQIVGVGDYMGQARGFLLQPRDLKLHAPTGAGVPGVNNPFVVTNATPGKTTYLLWSEAAGSTPLEGICFGLKVDLKMPMIASTDVADEDGMAELPGLSPMADRGTSIPVHYQAIEPASGRKSNRLTLNYP